MPLIRRPFCDGRLHEAQSDYFSGKLWNCPFEANASLGFCNFTASHHEVAIEYDTQARNHSDDGARTKARVLQSPFRFGILMPGSWIS